MLVSALQIMKILQPHVDIRSVEALKQKSQLVASVKARLDPNENFKWFKLPTLFT